MTVNPDSLPCAMAMSVGRSGDTQPEMNTTPLIDVMLVLLVMLIVTIPIQTHAVKLVLPTEGPQTVQPTAVHELVVDFDGAIAWDGKSLPTRAALDSIFASIARQPNQDEIHMAPNRLASYGLVAQILADAQRLGVRKIGFTGEERYQH